MLWKIGWLSGSHHTKPPSSQNGCSPKKLLIKSVLLPNGRCGIQVRPPNQQQRPSVFILLLWVHTTELLYCNSLLVYERGAAPHLVHGEHRGIFPHKQIQILGRLIHLDRENTGHLYHRVITSRGAKPIIFFKIGNLLKPFLALSNAHAHIYIRWCAEMGWNYFCRFVFVCFTS